MTDDPFMFASGVREKTSPANSFPYILVHLCEFGLQVL